MSSESKQVDEPGKARPLPDANTSKNASTITESGSSAGDTSSADVKAKSTGSKSGSSGIDLNDGRLKAILDKNPAWKDEVKNIPDEQVKDYITAKLENMLISAAGKNVKDMGAFTFWKTQPVPKFDEEDNASLPDGSIRENDLSKVSKEPVSLALDAFEWVTMDLNDDVQMTEVYTLLSGHYVEDLQATFRFNYSAAFLNWALKSPGWHKDWHVGVRTKESKKLVAFISGIPVRLRVRDNVIDCSEINFLCVHKKLRAKRLAPVLIKEITRRCNVKEIWQAVYTVGMVLPRPVSTCRYFHRSLDWLKLYEINFSPLPPGSTKQRQIAKYILPTQTETKGLRPMEFKDVEQVQSLLTRYLKRFDMAPEFSIEEVEHWFLHKEGTERVLWSYVVENPKTKKITDFFSFYNLESSVLQSPKHTLLKAAYLFYYATETAFDEDDSDRKKLKARLNKLIFDALIIAKKFKFDVFNALTLLDNGLFLTDQKFGAGDGLLHYYLFNWRTKHIAGGLDEQGKIDDAQKSEVGLVML